MDLKLLCAIVRRKPAKTLVLMKLSTLILLSVSLQLSARSYSQHVTLTFKHAKLEAVFRSIEEQTPLHFIYGSEDIDDATDVSINVKDVPVEKALDICFAGQPLAYTISENYITVKIKKTILSADTTEVITGVVMDEKDKPLLGVTVTDKRSGKATATDAAGEFTMQGIRGQAILVISNVGYTTQEIKLGN